MLAEPLKSGGLDFTEEPLENVFNFLQDEYGIPIQIDEPALEDAGMTRDEPVTVQSARNLVAIRIAVDAENEAIDLRDPGRSDDHHDS